MKLCKLCQFTYDDRVEFCFRDGTPLQRLDEDAIVFAQPDEFEAQEVPTEIATAVKSGDPPPAKESVFSAGHPPAAKRAPEVWRSRPRGAPEVEVRRRPTLGRGGVWEATGTSDKNWPDAPMPPVSTPESPDAEPKEATDRDEDWLAPEDDSISSVRDELAAEGGFPEPEDEAHAVADTHDDAPPMLDDEPEIPTQPVLPPVAQAFPQPIPQPLSKPVPQQVAQPVPQQGPRPVAQPAAPDQVPVPVAASRIENPSAAYGLLTRPETRWIRFVVPALVALLCVVFVATWWVRRHPAEPGVTDAVRSTSPPPPMKAGAAVVPASPGPEASPEEQQPTASDPGRSVEQEVLQTRPRAPTAPRVESIAPESQVGNVRQGTGTQGPPVQGAVAEKVSDHGTFSIDSIPSGADVYFDDKLVGRTPIQKLEGPSGLHTVAFRKEGFGTISRAVEITPSGDVELSPIQLRSLEPSVGTVNVSSSKMAPGSKLFIDGALTGVLPVSVKLPEGDHTFRVLSPDGTSFSVMRKVGFSAPGQEMSLELSSGG